MPVTTEAKSDQPKTGKHNVGLALRFRAKPRDFLVRVADSCSLAAAAADFELLRRG